MSKHTPGPWRVHPGDRIHVYAHASSGPNAGAPGLICQVFDREFPNDYEANARLIAAAPEMAGALRSILESYSSDEINEQPILVAARAALAKGGL